MKKVKSFIVFRNAKKAIKKCKNLAEVRQADALISLCYERGQLTYKQYIKLDKIINQKVINF